MSWMKVFLFCVVIGGVAYAGNPASVDYVNRLLAPGTHQIGDYAEGGVIFWLSTDRKHGLVADIVDLDGGSGVRWDNAAVAGLVGSRATGIVFGADIVTPGLLNTQQIVAIQGDATYAAQLCLDRSVTVNGVTYSDWYLPDIVELGVMYIRKDIIDATATAPGRGGTAFAAASYWSSFDDSTTNAWGQSFTSGFQGAVDKPGLRRVRAVRAF